MVVFRCRWSFCSFGLQKDSDSESSRKVIGQWRWDNRSYGPCVMFDGHVWCASIGLSSNVWIVMSQAPLLGGGGRRAARSAFLTAGIAVASVVVLVLLAGETRRISLIQQQLVDVPVSGSSFPTFYGGGQELAGKASNPNNNCGGWEFCSTAIAEAYSEKQAFQEQDQSCCTYTCIHIESNAITLLFLCTNSMEALACIMPAASQTHACTFNRLSLHLYVSVLHGETILNVLNCILVCVPPALRRWKPCASNACSRAYHAYCWRHFTLQTQCEASLVFFFFRMFWSSFMEVFELCVSVRPCATLRVHACVLV